MKLISVFAVISGNQEEENTDRDKVRGRPVYKYW